MRSALEAGAEGLAKSGPSVGAPGATFLDDTEADPVFPKKESDGVLFRTCRSARYWPPNWATLGIK